MLHFVLFIISVIITSFIGINAANALFVPGASITMTGSNSEVRFDVANALSGFDATVPSLVTASSTFTGVFYANGIGWIEFYTGAYTVGLNCGAQSLSSLTANCNLTNTGWSENIGEIGFSGVRYNPTTGLLEGKISSNMGDIDLSGIALPLKAVEINESDLIANHNTNISVKTAWIYEAGTASWNITMTPVGTAQSQSYAGISGIFSVDASLASTYNIMITDTNGSTTTSSILVSNNTPSTSLIAGSHFSDIFCSALPSDSRCPDGAAKSATTLAQVPPTGSIFANGTDTYTVTHKIRDGYGNRISTGDLRLGYTTTVKNVQVTDNLNYSSMDGDAFISTELGTGLGGLVDKTLGVGVSDISYTIASTAPTNTDNQITLNSVIYRSGSVNTPLLFTPPVFSFLPIYAASVTTGSTPIVGTPHPFYTDITKNDTSSSITPTIVSTLKIGGGSNSEWRVLMSNPTEICANYPATINTGLCDWSDSMVSILATESLSSFGFTGTYTGLYTDPPLESTHIDSYIYHQIGGADIFYKSIPSTIGTATAPSERVKLMGTTSNGLNGTEARVRLIDSIRKQTKLLSRNRDKYPANMTAYNDTDVLIIENQNYSITTNDIFAGGGFHGKAKRAIIVIGGDLMIENNIVLGANPIALIALSDMNNQGGNIRIKGSITDIHSTLIAEHAIISERSNSQLYIHGSIVSANPPREIAPTSCPYFVSAGCTKSDYDLPDMRSTYVSPTNSSIGGGSNTAPIVIEADARLLSNSPSILKQ